SVSFNGGGTLYKNLKDQVSLTETEMFGKEFLITEMLDKLDWKLTGETKKIGIYNCYKATAVIKAEQDEAEDKALTLTSDRPKDRSITAWYTPDVPVSNGPSGYWGLPGLILEVSDGRTTLLCSKITLNPKEKFEIKAPKKGSKVNRKEFDEIMEKKSREMMDMNDGPSAPGAGTTRRIIRIGG
ncbi:GLPGLI family protein, partial [uncultured Flavobacterium sp.]|uniref:GLPGLI family protein n=1 Tax=uncultured Flavobacterium sp. TaxID=165435 RepID=UPI0025F9A0EA